MTLPFILLGVLLLSGCGQSGSNSYGASSNTTYNSTPPTTPIQPPTPQTSDTGTQAGSFTLKTETNTALGTILVADNGMTLYTYAPDSAGVSNCYGTCATAWPPYMASSGQPLTMAAGISGKLSTIKRSDGTMEIAYNNRPLYFFAKDAKTGDTNGQGLGGVWYVVKP